MTDHLKHIGPDIRDALQLVGKAGQQLAYPTYVVGGFVRDLLLERGSKKDIDFVCVGKGIKLATTAANLLEHVPHVATFKTYGTAMFRFKDIDLEFVGARKESYRKDSRNPIVEDGTLEDDQLRRDFTINAMAISLNSADFGALVDPFDGVADLERKLIRTPLDPIITFSDDPLRMMRAVRFASQLGFTIEEKTFQAICEQKNRIKIISQERITEELNKIIASNLPSIGFKLLFDSGLLKIIFPEMVKLYGVEEKNGVRHKDNFYHTLQVLDNLSATSTDLWLRWAAVLHDIAKPPTKRFHHELGWTFHGHEVLGARMVPKIFKRMKLPLNESMKFVQKLVALHLRPISLTNENVSDSAIRRLLFDAGDDIDALMLLCRADITSKNKQKVARYLQNYEMVSEKLVEVEANDKIRNWQPPITGEIIMKAFQLKPSRAVGDIKKAIREAILDGDIPNDYDSAYQLMLSLGKEMGLES